VTDNPAVILAGGFKGLLTLLRHKLLTTTDIDEKIATCSAIQDCAHAWNATRPREDHDLCVAIPKAFLRSLNNVSSVLPSDSATASLVSILDGLTTSLRLTDPSLAALCRRSLETAVGVFKLAQLVPFHISSDDVEVCTVESMYSIIRPAVPDRPSRAAGSSADDAADLLPKNKTLKSIHWKLYNIEITAAEICAAIPLLYTDLPPALDLVLALQTYDEGRHTRQLLEALRRHGADDRARMTCEVRIWDNMRMGRSLVEAICIEQILGEGYSIGTDLCLAQMFEDMGYPDLAEVHRSVHADEFMHASQGMMWFRELAGPDADSVIAVLEPRFANPPPAEPWFRTDLRQQAGFSDAQIARQRQLAKPVEL